MTFVLLKKHTEQNLIKTQFKMERKKGIDFSQFSTDEPVSMEN
jgi:hypothetical protein